MLRCVGLSGSLLLLSLLLLESGLKADLGFRGLKADFGGLKAEVPGGLPTVLGGLPLVSEPPHQSDERFLDFGLEICTGGLGIVAFFK